MDIDVEGVGIKFPLIDQIGLKICTLANIPTVYVCLYGAAFICILVPYVTVEAAESR